MIICAHPPNGTYRIYVVDDSAILRRLLLEMLGRIPGAEVIGHSGRAEEAIAEIGKAAPAAIIVDLMLETGTGYDVLEAVAGLGPKAPLRIVLTNYTMPPYPEQAALLGAEHFFDKSTEILRMSHVVREAVDTHARSMNARSTAKTR